ncbi:hypothetical protein, partial [Klebsiella pneumoniae]|uniref:hypothetical protein n=1 Tax=Klebsiella pneumoniae TaxID=573 RepID=UPI0037C0D29A
MPTMPALIRIPSVLLLSLACSQALAAVPAKAPVRAPATEELALEPVMAGEFALQAGKLAEAARWYLQAAQQTDGDAGLAESAEALARPVPGTPLRLVAAVPNVEAGPLGLGSLASAIVALLLAFIAVLL